MLLYLKEIKSPAGKILLGSSEKGLYLLSFINNTLEEKIEKINVFLKLRVFLKKINI